MPRMKLDDSDFNIKALDVEYDPDQTSGDFVRYDGDIAPTGTVLNGRLTKMWWAYSKDGDSMIKLVCVAEGNEDDPDVEEFEGLSSWDNITFKPDAAFKYQPFLEYFGITLKDIKFKLMVASDDDPKMNATPINAIAWFEPGTDDALCRYTVVRDRWNGKWRSKVDRFLPLEDDEGVEPEEEERPARTRKPAAAKAKPARAAANGRRRAKPEPEDDYDEDDDYEDEPEDEEPERPARRARTAAKASNSRPATRTRTSTRQAATRSGGAAKASSKPARRGRQSDDDGDGGYDDEPPF